MVARLRGLEGREWFKWIKEDDAVIMCHFSWKSGRLFLDAEFGENNMATLFTGGTMRIDREVVRTRRSRVRGTNIGYW